MNSVSLLELFGIFFYIGLFTIGGGLVTLTLIQQMVVDRGLITHDTFVNMIAISESTPGPFGINMATFVGYNLHGVLGSIVVTVGEVLPSIICILIIAKFLTRFQDKPIIQSTMICLRPTATGLVLVATVNILLATLFNLPSSVFALKLLETWKNLFKWKNLIFYVISTISIIKTNFHPLVFIVLGAIFGIVFL